MHRVRSIRTKLLITLIPVVFVAITAMTVFAVQKMTDAQRRSVSSAVANANREQAARFDGEAQQDMAIARTLAAVGSAAVGTSRSLVLNMEKQVLDRNPRLVGVYIDYAPNAFDGRDAEFRGSPGSDKTGIFGSYWNRLGGKENLAFGMAGYQTLAWWTQPRTTGADSYIEPYLWDGSLLASHTTPIHHDGRFVGVAGDDELLTALDKRVSAIRVLSSGYSFVISHTGILVSYPRHKLVGSQTLQQVARTTHTPALATIAAALGAGRSGSIETKDPVSGKDVTMFYTPVAAGGWGFVSVAPNAEILASAHSLRNQLVVIALITLIILAAAIAFVATRLAKPANQVSRAARQISHGDLGVHIDSRSQDEIGQVAQSFEEMVGYLSRMADSADEIAAGRLDIDMRPASDRDRLGVAFSRMRDRLEVLIRQIAATSGRVASSSRDMASVSEQSGRAIGEVAHAVEHVAQGAERQVQALAGTKSHTEAMLAAAASTREAAQQTAELAETARAVASEGAAAVARVSDAMEAAKRSGGEVGDAARDVLDGPIDP